MHFFFVLFIYYYWKSFTIFDFAEVKNKIHRTVQASLLVLYQLGIYFLHLWNKEVSVIASLDFNLILYSPKGRIKISLRFMVILLIMQQVLTNLQNNNKKKIAYSLGYIEHATKHYPSYSNNICIVNCGQKML